MTYLRSVFGSCYLSHKSVVCGGFTTATASENSCDGGSILVRDVLLFWLCGATAVWTFRHYVLPLFHTYIIPHYIAFVKRFSKNICNYFSYTSLLMLNRFVSESHPSESVRTVLEGFVSACPLFLAFGSCVPLLTYLLYHIIGQMSRGNYSQSFGGKMARSVQNAQNGSRADALEPTKRMPLSLR